MKKKLLIVTALFSILILGWLYVKLRTYSIVDFVNVEHGVAPIGQGMKYEEVIMNIEARYPEYKEKVTAGLSNDICVRIIEETEELLCWIKKQL